MAKAKKQAEVIDPNNELKKRAAAAGLGSIIRLASEMPDLRVQALSTGFPQLDRLINPILMGLPMGIDVEIFSKKFSAGKTTLALQIAAFWQMLGYKVGILDFERTITDMYLQTCRIIMQDMLIGERQIYAPIFVRPQKELISVEIALDAIKFLSSPEGGNLDIIVVDSVAALDTAKNLERETIGEASQYGGASKPLTEHMRRNIAKQPTILWINQAKQKMSSYGPPSYKTGGGEGLKFFSSIRFDMTRVENIKLNKDSDETFGFKTKIIIDKNKHGRDQCAVTMTYVPGEGFSVVQDWIDIASKLGLIRKNGSWFYFDEKPFHGAPNMYYAFKTDSGLLNELQAAVLETEQKLNGIAGAIAEDTDQVEGVEAPEEAAA